MEMIVSWLISPLSWVGLKWALPWSVFSLPVGFLSLCSFYTFCHLQAPFFFFSVSLKSIHHLSLVSFTGGFESASFPVLWPLFYEGNTPGDVWTWSACPASVPRWHRATWVPILHDTARRRVSPICTEHTEEPLRRCRRRKESATSCNQEWMSVQLGYAMLLYRRRLW